MSRPVHPTINVLHWSRQHLMEARDYCCCYMWKKKITNIAFNCLTLKQRRHTNWQKKKKNYVTPCFFAHALPLLYPSDGEVKVQFCKSAREIKVLACYNDSHPPTNLFPVEGHHRQSVSKKSQDSLINLLTVAEGNKDRYCRRGGRETELQHGYMCVPVEKVKRRQATTAAVG